MRALIRRSAGRAEPVYEHEGVSIDPQSREVTVNGAPVTLTAREWAVLEPLIARPGMIYSRAQLEEKLYSWKDSVSSNAVEVYIHGLRKKLGQDLIQNVRASAMSYQNMSIPLSYSLRARLLFFLLAAIVVGALVQGTIAYRSTLQQADDIFDSLLQRTALSLGTGDGLLSTGPTRARRRHALRRRSHHPDLDAGRTARLQLPFAAAAAGPDRAGLLRRQGRRQHLPRLFAGHAIPGDPGGAGHGRAHPHGALPGAAHHRADRRGRATADAGHLVRGQLVAAARKTGAGAGGRAPTRRPVARQHRGRAGRDPPAAAGTEPTAACAAPSRCKSNSSAMPRTSCARRWRRCACNRKALQRAGDPESRRVAEQRLTAGIDRATRLIEQLLSLARHEGAAERPAPDRVDLDDVVRQAVSETLPDANAKSISLAMHAPAPIQVRGHRDDLVLLVRNLLDNAIKYSPPGSRIDLGPDRAGRPRLAHGRRPGPRHRARRARARLRPLLPRRGQQPARQRLPGDRPLDRRRPPCLDRPGRHARRPGLARAGGFSRRLTSRATASGPAPPVLRFP